MRIVLVFDEQVDIPTVPVSHPNTSRTFSRCLPREACKWVDHTDFVKEEPTRSPLLDQDSGHLCGGRRVRLSGHSDWNVYQISGRFPFLLACKLILRRLLVRPNLVALLLHPLLIRDADEPLFSDEPESSFAMSPWDHDPALVFCRFGSRSAFLRWQMSISGAKWKVLCSFCASRMPTVLLFTLVICPHRQLFGLRPSLSTAPVASGIFITWGIRTNLSTRF